MATEEIELGYLAWAGDTPHPGVVLIHDVWGLSNHTRDLARRLATEGFSVLAVDLYRREKEVKIENPGVWMRGLSDPQVLEDLQASVDFLAAHPSTEGRGIGVTGFCMGGSYAILAACTCSGLQGSVAYYGLLSYEHGLLYGDAGPDPRLKPRQPLDAVADLACPLLCFFGDRDEFVPMADVQELRQRLVDAPQPGEVVVFPGAGHAFVNDTREDAYRPEDAARAWERMLEFFRKRLD